MVVAGRARAVVIGVGSNTAVGSIRDAMIHTEDVCILLLCFVHFSLLFCVLYNTAILFFKFYYLFKKVLEGQPQSVNC